MGFIRIAQRIGRHHHAKDNGVVVSYSFIDTGLSIEVLAVAGSRRTEAYEDDNTLIDRQMQDWVIELNELPRYPQRNDTITWNGNTYQVIHPGGGREAEYHDLHGESVRVHTMIIGTPATGYPPEQPKTSYGTLTGDVYSSPSGDAYVQPEDE